MKKIFDIFSLINKFLMKVEKIAGSVCLGVLFTIMMLNAVLRYVFKSGINFSDELNQFLFVWFGFLSAAYAMGNDSHLNVTAIFNLFPKPVRFAVKQIINIIMIYFFVIYQAPLFKLLGSLAKSNVMRIPLKYVYFIIPLSFGLMTIHIIYNDISQIKAYIEEKKNV